MPKNKHKHNKQKKEKKVIIPVNVVLDKVNQELRDGRIVLGTSTDGVTQLELAEIRNRTIDGHVYECEANAILSVIADQLVNMSSNMDCIASDVADVAAAVNEMKNHHAGSGVLHAEPIKMFPDDTIKKMIEDEVSRRIDEINNSKRECKCNSKQEIKETKETKE